jgi:ubiquinone/menaquinone biosynthesis C-methylase UbiE
MEENKIILDACCGSRMMWFDKKNPLATFMDIREEEQTLCDGRHLEVKPDVVADFTDMPFPDGSFRLVVFDPPHLKNVGGTSWMAKKYGRLLPTWETDIKAGFDECMRVLEPFGVLIFKWNECQIKMTHLLEVIKAQPLFGHPTGKNGSTVWMCFMKIPKQ